MNRLRDETGEDPVAERGIELVRGVPPAPRTGELKRRVWMSLERSKRRPAYRVRVRSLRMVALTIAVLCAAGSAGAVIARRWMMPIFHAAAPAPTATRESRPALRSRTSAEPTSAPPTRPAVESEAPLRAPSVEAPVVRPIVTRPAPVTRPASVTRPAIVTRPAAVRRATAPTAARVPPAEVAAQSVSNGDASTRERTEVLDAMIALRRDHDPLRAGALLDRYLAAHPRGVLREEALVLAIEAAGERGDRASARSLAQVYQSAYPTGRFIAFARSQTGAIGP